MAARNRLMLHEELLLLALDDSKGTSGVGSQHGIAMGGAILAELVLRRAVRLTTEKKKRFVEIDPGAQVDDALLGECLSLVRQAKRRRQASEWVMKFAGLKNLKKRVAHGLVVRGVLGEEQDRVLGIFPRTVFPERDPGPERDLIERLRRAVLDDTGRVDERTLVVAVIAGATSLLERAVDKKQLKARKERMKQLAEGQGVGAATAEAIQAAQAAAAVAVMIATTAATSAATR